MADDTDTTHPGETEAVATVMPYLCVSGSAEHCGAHRAVCVPAAEAIVAAAYPVIAAAVREQAAQDIEREAEREKDHFPPRWPGDTFWEGVTSGKRRAAGIARDSR